MNVMAVSCNSEHDISASSKNGINSVGISQGTYVTYNLPSLHYTYSAMVIGIIDSLEQSHSHQNGLIFMKAMNSNS